MGLTTPRPSSRGCRAVLVDSDLAPADATVIVYTHGGGLTAGSSITHRAFASRLAVACRARVLLVDYRLLPEHPISAPIDDVVAVVEHVVSTGDVGADRLFLAGDSSGAALAIGTARRLRDRGRAGHRLASSACPARSTPR